MGLWLRNARDVQLRDSIFVDHGEGVRFDWSRQDIDMRDVYVQRSVEFQETRGRLVQKVGSRAAELPGSVVVCSENTSEACE